MRDRGVPKPPEHAIEWSEKEIEQYFDSHGSIAPVGEKTAKELKYQGDVAATMKEDGLAEM